MGVKSAMEKPKSAKVDGIRGAVSMGGGSAQVSVRRELVAKYPISYLPSSGVRPDLSTRHSE